MKLFAVVAIAFAILYNVVVKAAVFMFCSFILVLATFGLYDLIILPFRKERKLGERRSA